MPPFKIRTKNIFIFKIITANASDWSANQNELPMIIVNVDAKYVRIIHGYEKGLVSRFFSKTNGNIRHCISLPGRGHDPGHCDIWY